MMANVEPINELEMIWKEVFMSTNNVIFLEGLNQTANTSLKRPLHQPVDLVFLKKLVVAQIVNNLQRFVVT